MLYCHNLEALDQYLKELMDNTHIFGGKLVINAGDFRQTLPVIPNGQ